MEEPVKTKCPLCGSNEYVESPLDEDIKDAFLESILGDSPFVRTYDVMGGKIAIKVTAISDEDNRLRASFFIKLFDATEKCPELKAYIPLIESALDVDGQIVEAAVTTNSGTTVVTREVNAGLKLVNDMDWGSITNDGCKEFVDEVLNIFNVSMFHKCTIPSPILRGVVTKHNTILNRLIRECMDKNFIEGTGR